MFPGLKSGIRLRRVQYLNSHPWVFPTSLMIGVQAEAGDATISIDPKEIEDAQWFTHEAVLAATVGENPVLKPAQKGSIAIF